MEEMKNEYSKIVGNNIRKYRKMHYIAPVALLYDLDVKNTVQFFK